MDAIADGALLLTVDQQAYLQGFDTIMQLFLFNISGGLMKPTDTDTGTAIVVKWTVGPVPEAAPAGKARARKETVLQATRRHPLLGEWTERAIDRSPQRWPSSATSPAEPQSSAGPAVAAVLASLPLAGLLYRSARSPRSSSRSRCSSSSRSTRRLSSPPSA